MTPSAPYGVLVSPVAGHSSVVINTSKNIIDAVINIGVLMLFVFLFSTYL